jgi:hypothetical protein
MSDNQLVIHIKNKLSSEYELQQNGMVRNESIQTI